MINVVEENTEDYILKEILLFRLQSEIDHYITIVNKYSYISEKEIIQSIKVIYIDNDIIQLYHLNSVKYAFNNDHILNLSLLTSPDYVIYNISLSILIDSISKYIFKDNDLKKMITRIDNILNHLMIESCNNTIKYYPK